MAVLMILATIADLALAFLLIAVSGFVMEGVNNTGPEMPGALIVGGMVLLCIAAPFIAWTMSKWPMELRQGIVWSPIGLALIALMFG